MTEEGAQDTGTALIDADGNFTDAFRTNLPTYLGDGHKDYQGLNDVKSLASLAKFAADNQVAARAKLDGHVKIPSEDATDEERAKFRTKSLTALNMLPPESAEGYEFPKPTEEIEGLGEDAEYNAKIKQAFHAAGVPAAMATKIIEGMNAVQIETAKANQAQAQLVHDQEMNKLKAECPGEDLAVCGREAYNALMKMKSISAELKEEIKKSGLYDKPTDFKLWKSIGISPGQLSMWREIGQLTAGSRYTQGDGSGGGNESPRAKAQREYPNSPDLWPKE